MFTNFTKYLDQFKGSKATLAPKSIHYNSYFVVDPNSYAMFVALLNMKTSGGSPTKCFVAAKKLQNHWHRGMQKISNVHRQSRSAFHLNKYSKYLPALITGDFLPKKLTYLGDPFRDLRYR